MIGFERGIFVALLFHFGFAQGFFPTGFPPHFCTRALQWDLHNDFFSHCFCTRIFSTLVSHRSFARWLCDQICTRKLFFTLVSHEGFAAGFAGGFLHHSFARGTGGVVGTGAFQQGVARGPFFARGQ